MYINVNMTKMIEKSHFLFTSFVFPGPKYHIANKIERKVSLNLIAFILRLSLCIYRTIMSASILSWVKRTVQAMKQRMDPNCF